ncbi:MAG: response regulator transcription factor [Blastocatellia bacterium]|nr:response regulator transcription factor [Blastocatellia bacterium]
MTNLPLISIVDDDASVRKSLERLIGSVGYAAKGFASAEEFLKSEHLRQTNCLILDVRMPGMSGIELWHELVADGSGIPVIFITAHGDKAARSQALKDGAVDYLFKPFSEESLLKAIHAALNSENRKQMAVENLTNSK